MMCPPGPAGASAHCHRSGAQRTELSMCLETTSGEKCAGNPVLALKGSTGRDRNDFDLNLMGQKKSCSCSKLQIARGVQFYCSQEESQKCLGFGESDNRAT